MTNGQFVYDENLSDQQNMVAFRLDEQIYAFPIIPVVQIIEMVTITPLPQANHIVEGIIDVRGTVVPVVNLGRHLGLSATHLQLHTPIILIQVNQHMIGLIVDEVLDVLGLPSNQVAHPDDILPAELGEARLLQGVAHTADGTVLLLDPAHLFLPHQQKVLAQAVTAIPEQDLAPTEFET